MFVIAIRELVPPRFVFLPDPDFVIKPSDILVVIGREKDLRGVQDWKKPQLPGRLKGVPLGVTPGFGASRALTIRLVTVGSLPPAMLGFLPEGLKRELGAAVRMGGNLPLPASCPEGRSQYPGEPFLAALTSTRSSGEELILGVTGVDLYGPRSQLRLWPGRPRRAPPSSLWPASTRSFTASPGTRRRLKSGPSKRRSTNWGTFRAWATAPTRPASCFSPTPWPTPTARGRSSARLAGICCRNKIEGGPGECESPGPPLKVPSRPPVRRLGEGVRAWRHFGSPRLKPAPAQARRLCHLLDCHPVLAPSLKIILSIFPTPGLQSPGWGPVPGPV